MKGFKKRGKVIDMALHLSFGKFIVIISLKIDQRI